MATRLFSAYPKSDYADPDAAHAAIVNVLKAYPLSVVNRLTNETEGEALQLKHKFPPRLAEIKEAADEIMTEAAQRKARENRLAEQIAARAEADRAAAEPRPTVDELKAKYGPTYGIDPDGADRRTAAPVPTRTVVIDGEVRKVVEKPFKTMTVEELRAHYAANPDRITKLTGAAGTR